MPELTIDYKKIKYVGHTTDNKFIFRDPIRPINLIVLSEAEYNEWRKQQGILPVIDAEGKYFALEADLAGIQKAVQRILDGHSREGQKELAEIMQRIRGRKV